MNDSEARAMIIKVAELIEEGSKGLMQMTGNGWMDDYQKPTAVCAIGSMAVAMGFIGGAETDIVHFVLSKLSASYETPFINVPGERYSIELMFSLILMNDKLKMPFPRICDILRFEADKLLPSAILLETVPTPTSEELIPV